MSTKTNVHEFDSTSAVQNSDAGHLLRLLDVSEQTSTRWSSADAEAMFQHQLLASLDFDLSGEAAHGATTVAALKDLPGAEKAGITTFGKLFTHLTPPISLLKLSKDFFKRTAKMHPKDSAEHQVAYLYYLLSVVVARLRHGKRITDLSDLELLKGVEWASKQTWVDDQSRNLLNGLSQSLNRTP
jgi:hypothetical protein